MVAFNKTTGEAQKSSLNQYTYKNGENRLRLVGEVLPRYIYWVSGENNKNIPMECLSFDREKEAFLNKEKDWVREFYPDLKCGWAYVMQGIDLDTGELKVINLKKKLFQQIHSLAIEDGLGDPTDPVEGWDVHFTRKKTGPNVFNVEYTVQALKCSNGKRPLTDEEMALVNNMTPIEDLLPRPTADAQKELLERITNPSTQEENEDPTLADEFDIE
jgi:hypothetical protein